MAPASRMAIRWVLLVNGGKPDFKAVCDLRGVLDQQRAALAILISLQVPTHDEVAEAVGAWFWRGVPQLPARLRAKAPEGWRSPDADAPSDAP